ncbi:hypothetical protein AgCh_019086 [Apium graveolens]
MVESGNNRKVRCKLRKKIVTRGVFRLKQHVVNIKGNVSSYERSTLMKCKKALDDVKLSKENKKKAFEENRKEVNITDIDKEELREELMEEAHRSPFSIHPGETKMYRDLKEHFWWSGMKRDIANFVSKCLTCQQVKIEH